MNLDELAVEYYHNSLELAQKSLLAGLTISAVAYLTAINGQQDSPYLIPILEIQIKSFNYFSITLLILFITCGTLCAHGVSKAIDNWSLIPDQELTTRLLHAPNILISGTIIHSILYGFLFMVGTNLSGIIFSISDWKQSIIGSIISLPYFIAISLSSKLKNMNKKLA